MAASCANAHFAFCNADMYHPSRLVWRA